MRRTRFRSSRFALHLISLASLLLSGCLEAKVHEAIVYDAQHDRFRYMQLYVHIAGHNASELQHLDTLWKKRDSIIVYPELAIFGRSALVRVAKNEFESISLGNVAESAPTAERNQNHPDNPPSKESTERSSIDLSTITIVAGEAFLSKDNTLCYFQEAEIPGAVLDAVLELLTKGLSDETVRGIDQELARRERGGGEGSWAEFRSVMMKELSGVPGVTSSTEQPDAPDKHYPLSILDRQSLERMRAVAAEKALGLKRQGATFELNLPLSQRDRREAMSTWDAAKPALLQDAENDADRDPTVLAVIQSVKCEEADQTLQISITLGAQLLSAKPTAMSKGFDPNKAAAYRNTIDYLKEQGVRIRNDMTIEDVAKQFLDGEKP